MVGGGMGWVGVLYTEDRYTVGGAGIWYDMWHPFTGTLVALNAAVGWCITALGVTVCVALLGTHGIPVFDGPGWA